VSNATSNLSKHAIGADGRRFHVPVDAGQHIYENTLISQLTATGMAVPTSTAGSGAAIGVATHEVDATAGSDGDHRLVVETDRTYCLTNGATTNAFSEASIIGSLAYAADDHTVYDNSNGGTLKVAGIFLGMEASGKVRVYVSPLATLLASLGAGASGVQVGSGAFTAGVLTVATGITVTASSRVIAYRVLEGGTDGDEIRILDADLVVGEPGTGTVVFRSYLSGVAATSDTSTIKFAIFG
jgi:hypothetical protein